MYFISFCILFYFFPILRVTAILAKCDGRFLQRWFCSVTSPCIFEAIHWSHPSHRAETELLWKFGVSTCSICKVILKFSSVTLLLQCPCWKPTTYHRFVDILSRYALFWWLVPEKIAFCLQHSETKYRYFIWAKRSTARRAAMVHCARRIALLLASFDVALPSEREKPSWIDWKISIFSRGGNPPPRVEVCLVGPGPPRASRVFEWAITQAEYRKSSSMFPSSEPVAARSDCSRLGNALCLCTLVCPARASRRAASRAWLLILHLNLWLQSGTAFWEIARLPARAQTWTQTFQLCHLTRLTNKL